MAGRSERPFRPRIRPFGDAALLLELGRDPDLPTSARVHALRAALKAANPPWLRALIPGFTSLLIGYDPLTADEPAVRALVRPYLAQPAPGPGPEGRSRVVPVIYGGADGPDLHEVALRTGFSEAEVVRRHCATEQTVYMLGFAPGFPYLGDHDPEIAIPRRSAPRLRVQAGSVGIAGRQTVIYSHASPGGWNIVGRTPLRLWDPVREPPAYLLPGDRVRFVPIEAAGWGAAAATPADW